MVVKVAEYFGQKTEDNPIIIGQVGTQGKCPFMNGTCVKLVKKNKPVCTVRNNDGELWIVCPDRS